MMSWAHMCYSLKAQFEDPSPARVKAAAERLECLAQGAPDFREYFTAFQKVMESDPSILSGGGGPFPVHVTGKQRAAFGCPACKSPGQLGERV